MRELEAFRAEFDSSMMWVPPGGSKLPAAVGQLQLLVMAAKLWRE